MTTTTTCTLDPNTCDCTECVAEGIKQMEAETRAENAWMTAAEYDPEARDEMAREASYYGEDYLIYAGAIR